MICLLVKLVLTNDCIVKEPPFYLQPLLHSIEGTTRDLWAEFESLTDKDVEWVYERLQVYYKQLASGKQVEEPLSTSDRKQALIDEILNIIDVREEMEADSGFINDPETAPGGRPIPSLAAMYVMAFKRLQQSARFWRKNGGPQGYLSFISSAVI